MLSKLFVPHSVYETNTIFYFDPWFVLDRLTRSLKKAYILFCCYNKESQAKYCGFVGNMMIDNI